MDNIQLVKDVLGYDHFAVDTVGVELLEITPEQAKAKLQIRPCHLNGLGIIQGGAIFTLADLTLAAAANASGQVAVLVNSTISYFKSVSQGTLYAVAQEESANPKLATYTVKVTDETGQLLALVQATYYRKKVSLAEVMEKRA